ncbi:hypothetical protein ACH4ZU_33610 [Streptomyces sp. NPDC020472]|uniref:hypothetical protein n=1 Tax=Streptomyces sp. NPDC020472 TaxID=3365075 RepID=UPI003795E8FE
MPRASSAGAPPPRDPRRRPGQAGGEEPGTLVLSDYDEPVHVKAPPAGETVDLARLDQGTSA